MISVLYFFCNCISLRLSTTFFWWLVSPERRFVVFDPGRLAFPRRSITLTMSGRFASCPRTLLPLAQSCGAVSSTHHHRLSTLYCFLIVLFLFVVLCKNILWNFTICNFKTLEYEQMVLKKTFLIENLICMIKCQNNFGEFKFILVIKWILSLSLRCSIISYYAIKYPLSFGDGYIIT